jgi:hypothetical protein
MRHLSPRVSRVFVETRLSDRVSTETQRPRRLTLLAAKRLRQRIDEIVLALGFPMRRATHREGGTTVHRTSWDCGCVVEYIDRLLDARDGDGGLHWSTCGEHRQIGLLSQAPGFSGTWATPEDALDVAQSDDCAHYGTKPASSRDKCCETVTLAVPSLALK